MNNSVNNVGLNNLAATPSMGSNGGRSGNWFEAFAGAWGRALDQQANVIVEKSEALGQGGEDKPSDITQLTAESMRMSFMANSSHTSLDSVSKALETMARKG
jgi:hypothetical protein